MTTNLSSLTLVTEVHKLRVDITDFRRSNLDPIERDLAMVDRAGFEPATFRTLDVWFAKRTIFGPAGIPD
jgi:hypothetical protein